MSDMWKPLFGVSQVLLGYEVSARGEVRSRCKTGRRGARGVVLTDECTPIQVVRRRDAPVMQVRLPKEGARGRVFYRVDELVARAFLPPPRPDQTVVWHKDGDGTNCDAENLEWVSASEEREKIFQQIYRPKVKERVPASEPDPEPAPQPAPIEDEELAGTGVTG